MPIRHFAIPERSRIAARFACLPSELQQLTARRLQQEAVLKADSLRITAQRTKALYQLTVTEDALADQKEALNRLLGRDLLEEFTVEMVPASLPEESSLQQARKVATENATEIKAETIKKKEPR